MQQCLNTVTLSLLQVLLKLKALKILYKWPSEVTLLSLCDSGVAGPLAARCGGQICCPFVLGFGNWHARREGGGKVFPGPAMFGGALFLNDAPPNIDTEHRRHSKILKKVFQIAYFWQPQTPPHLSHISSLMLAWCKEGTVIPSPVLLKCCVASVVA